MLKEIAIACLSFLYLQTVSAAGPLVGGGSDLIDPEAGAAWFLDNTRTIKACIEVAPDFTAASPAQLQVDIKRAAKQWETYYWAKKGESLPGQPFPKDSMELVFDLNLSPAKVGDCDVKKNDLIFYFGVNNAMISSVQQLHTHPFAFAVRTDYSELSGWGKGFVWMTAKPLGRSWPDHDAIYGEILHEMGHVFGSEHISGTIMDENIAQLVFTDLRSGLTAITDSDRSIQLNKIDQDHELLVGDLHYQNTQQSAHVLTDIGLGQVPALFQRLMNRAPQGNVFARIDAVIDNPLNITIGDAIGQTTFTSPFTQSSQNYFASDRKVFFRSRVNPDPNSASGSGPCDLWEAGGQAVSYVGQMTSVGSNAPDIMISVNWNQAFGNALEGFPQRKDFGFAPVTLKILDLKAQVNAEYNIGFSPVNWM